MARLIKNRYLALDVGDRRIGLAVGSLETGIAQPIEILDRSRGDAVVWQRLREVVKEEKTGTVLVGDPLNMDGTVGERSEKARQFAKWLKGALRQVDVKLYDERLSTFEADQRMEKDGIKKSKRSEWRDAYAAAVILEEFFEAKRDAADFEGE